MPGLRKARKAYGDLGAVVLISRRIALASLAYQFAAKLSDKAQPCRQHALRYAGKNDLTLFAAFGGELCEADDSRAEARESKYGFSDFSEAAQGDGFFPRAEGSTWNILPT